MSMNHIDDFSNHSADYICKLLALGGELKTNVPLRSEDATPASDTVILAPSDRHCSECGEELDEYGPRADFVEIAARIKRKYGRTICADCHNPSTNSPGEGHAMTS